MLRDTIICHSMHHDILTYTAIYANPVEHALYIYIYITVPIIYRSILGNLYSFGCLGTRSGLELKTWAYKGLAFSGLGFGVYGASGVWI